MKEIIVKYKEVCGNILFYPVCEQSKVLAHLMHRKSFTPNQLKVIQTFFGKLDVIVVTTYAIHGKDDEYVK